MLNMINNINKKSEAQRLPLIGLKIIIISFITLVSLSIADNNASDFLESGLSARATALGNTCTSRTGGIDNVFFNPASLANNVENIDFTSSAVNNFEEVDRKNIGCGINGKKFGWSDTSALGLNFSTSYISNILKTEWQEERPVVTGKFNSDKNNLTITYSNAYDQFLSYGFNLRKYSYTIDKYYANAWGLDAGFLYRLPNNILDSPAVVGVVIHNICRTTVGWSTGHADTIPLRLSAGISLYRNLFNNKLVLSLDAEKTEIENAIWRFGTEYWLVNNMLALRAGLDNNQLAYGVGLQYHELSLDYGQTEFEELGLIKRITVSYHF